MAAKVGHVVVFVQENHSTDNYFASMRAWGGVPRLDDAPNRADLVADAPTTPSPPAYGTAITRPTPPQPTPDQRPLPPPPSPTSVPVGPVLLRNGATLPPPNDQPVH